MTEFRELSLLVSHAIDGTADAEELLRLEHLLTENRDARRFYYVAVAMHAQCAWQFSEMQNVEAPVAAAPRRTVINSPRASSTSVPRVPSRFQRGLVLLSQPTAFGLFFASVTCISLLLFFAQIQIHHPATPTATRAADARATVPPTAASAAQLTRTVQARWAQGTPDTHLGAYLRAGESLHLVQGMIELTFGSDVKTILVAPVQFQVLAPDQLALQRGSLTARVPESGRGFKIDTPAARVVDLGTEFGVAVWGDSTGVEVFTGNVVVESAGRSPSRWKLGAGNSLAIARHSPTVVLGKVKTNFVRELPPLEKETWPKDRPLAAWKFDGRGQAEPNTALPDERLTGTLGVSTEAESLDPVRLAREAARVGEGSLEFRGKQLVYVPQHPLLNEIGASFTITAWFRATQPLGAIVYRKDEDQNPKIELMVRGGVPFLAVRDPFGAETVVSAPNRRVDDGRWWHIAAVKTPEVLQLYLDGKPLAEAPLPRDFGRLTFSAKPPLLLGAYMWQDSGEFGGFLTGAMDEVSIWPRALNSEEVQQLYQAAPKIEPPPLLKTPAAPAAP